MCLPLVDLGSTGECHCRLREYWYHLDPVFLHHASLLDLQTVFPSPSPALMMVTLSLAV